MQRQPVLAADLAQPAREQLAIAVVHLRPNVAQQRERFGAVRAGDALGDGRPRRELDELAVE